jgi:hypothetical protein
MSCQRQSVAQCGYRNRYKCPIKIDGDDGKSIGKIADLKKQLALRDSQVKELKSSIQKMKSKTVLAVKTVVAAVKVEASKPIITLIGKKKKKKKVVPYLVTSAPSKIASAFQKEITRLNKIDKKVSIAVKPHSSKKDLVAAIKVLPSVAPKIKLVEKEEKKMKKKKKMSKKDYKKFEAEDDKAYERANKELMAVLDNIYELHTNAYNKTSKTDNDTLAYQQDIQEDIIEALKDAGLSPDPKYMMDLVKDILPEYSEKDHYDFLYEIMLVVGPAIQKDRNKDLYSSLGALKEGKEEKKGYKAKAVRKRKKPKQKQKQSVF